MMIIGNLSAVTTSLLQKMFTYSILSLSLIGCFNGIVEGQFLTHNCAQHRAKARSRIAQGSDFVGLGYSNFDRSKLEELFVPECEGNRIDYAPKQCFEMGRSFCACAATNGTMLTDWRDNIKACNCLRAQEDAKKAAGYSGVPLCDQSGLFQKRQCIQHGWCDIVDPRTGYVIKGYNDLDSLTNQHSGRKIRRPGRRLNRHYLRHQNHKSNEKFEPSEEEEEEENEDSGEALHSHKPANRPSHHRVKNIRRVNSEDSFEEDNRRNVKTNKGRTGMTKLKKVGSSSQTDKQTQTREQNEVQKTKRKDHSKEIKNTKRATVKNRAKVPRESKRSYATKTGNEGSKPKKPTSRASERKDLKVNMSFEKSRKAKSHNSIELKTIKTYEKRKDVKKNKQPNHMGSTKKIQKGEGTNMKGKGKKQGSSEDLRLSKGQANAMDKIDEVVPGQDDKQNQRRNTKTSDGAIEENDPEESNEDQMESRVTDEAQHMNAKRNTQKNGDTKGTESSEAKELYDDKKLSTEEDGIYIKSIDEANDESGGVKTDEDGEAKISNEVPNNENYSEPKEVNEAEVLEDNKKQKDKMQPDNIEASKESNNFEVKELSEETTPKSNVSLKKDQTSNDIKDSDEEDLNQSSQTPVQNEEDEEAVEKTDTETQQDKKAEDEADYEQEIPSPVESDETEESSNMKDE